MFGQSNALGVNRRDGAVARETHAEHLGEAVHRVRGVHARAGAAGRAGLFLKFTQFFFRNLARTISADSLRGRRKAHLAAVHFAGEHRAAADKDGRNVEPCRRHEEAGDVFVAVGDHDECVKSVCHCHRLGRIGDEVAGDKGVLHPLVAHGDAVTHCDCWEHGRGAACHRDAEPNRLGDLVDVHMAGDNLVVGAHDADEGALHFFFGKAERVE